MPSAGSPSNSHLTPIRSLTPVGRANPDSSPAHKVRLDNEQDYDVTLLNPERYKKKYNCVLCDKVLRYPVKFSECGHHCCTGCFKQLLRVEPRCPMDQIKFDRYKVTEDRNFQLELDTIEVKCPNHTSKCPWTGTYKNIQDHVEVCAFKVSVCPKNCGAKFEKCFLQRHLRDDCPYREVKCQSCQQTFAHSDKSNHLNTCKKHLVTCTNGCKARVVSQEMDNHIENECPNLSILCPYADAGCQFKCLRRDMDAHLRRNLDDHVTMVTRAIRDALKAVQSIRENEEERINNTNLRLRKVQTRNTGLIKQYESHLIWKIDGFEEKYKEAKRAGEENICVHSPYVAVTRYGYRLKMIAYLCGYGSVEGLYMSMYVCLCSTEHDLLLEWPFHRTIELTLLDQCPDPHERHDVTYCIDTSQEEEHLISKPEDSKNNPYFGTDKFIEIEKLLRKDHYSLGDAIFIRINFLPPSLNN